MLRCAGFVGESLALRKDRIIRTRRSENWSPQLDSASPFPSPESRYVAHRSHATRGWRGFPSGCLLKSQPKFRVFERLWNVGRGESRYRERHKTPDNIRMKGFYVLFSLGGRGRWSGKSLAKNRYLCPNP